MAAKQNQSSSVQCIDCQWAKLMQWFENPVIALCERRDERQVAATRRFCKDFIKRTTQPTIQHFDSYD